MTMAPRHPSSRKMFVPCSRVTLSWPPLTPAPWRRRVERFKRVRSAPCKAPGPRYASAGGGLLEKLLRVVQSPMAAERRSPAIAADPCGAAATRARVIWVGKDRAPGSCLVASRRPSRHRPAPARRETARRGSAPAGAEPRCKEMRSAAREGDASCRNRGKRPRPIGIRSGLPPGRSQPWQASPHPGRSDPGRRR